MTQAEGVVAAVGECKAEIRRAVVAAVDRLRAETGLAPSAIGIDMVETTHVGQAVRQYVVGEVTVDLGRL